jgi:4-diphosphocytidyl-2-C-methyl-D-erythritol kinase
MHRERFAPAKVNLFLHVGPLQDDGYHPVCSLMSFANLGDVVHLQGGVDEMGFELIGPYAEGLRGADQGNLVTRARDAFLALYSGAWPTFRLVLDKQLPIAAGIGGGSSDAAATLDLLCEVFAVDPRADDIAQIARDLGADVSACRAGSPMVGRGRGDDLDFPPTVFPDVDAVLVNPNRPSPTGAVYRAFDAMAQRPEADEPMWPEAIETPRELAAFLSRCRNDLEAPAISLQPAIAEVLAALRARPETLLARMSGSGATCFALCGSAHEARDLARWISDLHPDWWVWACRLAGCSP